MWTFQLPEHGKERREGRTGRGRQKSGKGTAVGSVEKDRECLQGKKQPLALLKHCSRWWKVIYTHRSQSTQRALKWRHWSAKLPSPVRAEPDWHPDGLHTWGHSLTRCRHCPVKGKGESSSALFSWGLGDTRGQEDSAVYMVPSIQASVVMTHRVYAGNCLDLHFPKVSHLVAGPLLLYRVTLCQFVKGTPSGWTT